MAAGGSVLPVSLRLGAAAVTDVNDLAALWREALAAAIDPQARARAAVQESMMRRSM